MSAPFPPNAHVLTVLNLKGGVGKTHTSWVLASVAQERGQRILLIDLDTQGNLSKSFLDAVAPHETVATLFDPSAEADPTGVLSFRHLYQIARVEPADQAAIVATVREQRLSATVTLTLANQYLAQLDEATAAAVFGNVGSLASFQVGSEDADALAMQLGAPITVPDLLALPKYEAYVRLLIDGLPSRPFSLCTLPPLGNTEVARRDVIRRLSRRRYGRPLAVVAAEIERGFATAVRD